MVLRLRAARLLVLFWSATLLAHVASADNNSSDPVDPSNNVLALGGNDEDVNPPPSTDHLASNSTQELNNEDNNVGPVNEPDFMDISVSVLPIALQTAVPRLTAGRSPLHPVQPELTPRVRTFRCTFDDHTCGMRNQKNIGPNFRLAANSIAGRPGRYMAVNASLVGYGVSRLITPYLPGNPNAISCLSLTYIVTGRGAERIQVVAQDVGNRFQFSLEDHSNDWRTFSTNMTANQDVRFFLEAYTNGHQGLIAIDDFTYSFDPCPSRIRP